MACPHSKLSGHFPEALGNGYGSAHGFHRGHGYVHGRGLGHDHDRVDVLSLR